MRTSKPMPLARLLALLALAACAANVWISPGWALRGEAPCRARSGYYAGPRSIPLLFVASLVIERGADGPQPVGRAQVSLGYREASCRTR